MFFSHPHIHFLLGQSIGSQPSELVIYQVEKFLQMTTKTFPGRFDSLENISKFVAKAAKSAGLEGPDVYAVRLAVDEACSNIIEHSYGGEGQGNIECTCETSNDGLSISLRDWGGTFDPNEILEPDFTVPLEELESRGAGLYFIRKMMDEVHFDFSSELGNVLLLIKRK